MPTYVSNKGTKTKGECKAIIEIASEDEHFKRIRRWGNAKGKKYIAVIFECEGEDYEQR